MKKYPVYDVQNFQCNAQHDDLYVNTFREHLLTHSFVEAPHRHNSYLLVFFTHGLGSHEIDFDTFEIQPGSLFVLQPGQIHNWNLSEDIDGFIVIFSEETYNLYFGNKKIEDYVFYASASVKPELVFSKSEIPSILPYFELLNSEKYRQQIFSKDKILNLLDCIHIAIARKYGLSEAHNMHPYNIKIEKFEKFVSQYFRENKLPSFYASLLSITPKHLNRICKEILGKTPTEVIANRVVLEAKRMLSDRQLSVNEIADKLGYDDYSYFTRLFKKQTGTTPGAFRNVKKSIN